MKWFIFLAVVFFGSMMDWYSTVDVIAMHGVETPISFVIERFPACFAFTKLIVIPLGFLWVYELALIYKKYMIPVWIAATIQFTIGVLSCGIILINS